jgi:predicted enzyme related to lactoylglutathione lyase
MLDLPRAVLSSCMTASWGLAVDCLDADKAVDFWCAALGYRRFGSAGQYRSALPAEGGVGPKLIFQAVSELKTSKNRLHIDILASDIELEAKRLCELGAVRIEDEPVSEHGMQWIVMRDIEGNEFCVCRE